MSGIDIFALIVLIIIIGTALAAFVILAWDKASGLSQEEKREVAILKMLGWQTGDVMAMGDDDHSPLFKLPLGCGHLTRVMVECSQE